MEWVQTVLPVWNEWTHSIQVTGFELIPCRLKSYSKSVILEVSYLKCDSVEGSCVVVIGCMFWIVVKYQLMMICLNSARWLYIGKLSKLHTRKRRVLGNTSIHLRLAPAQDPTLMFEQTRLRRLLMFIVIIFELFTLLCCIPLNMCPVRQNTP